MEHHSNIVPWQMAAEAVGARVEPIAVNSDGTLDLDALAAQLDDRVKMVAVGHVSNALGSINPVAQIIAMAREAGACTLIDAAQSIAHWPIDVQALDCDFLVFSGHKMFGPTGIGALYGKRELLEAMPPYQGGGEMIESVSFAGTVYNQLPYKFEAGTPNIAGVIALGAAVDYLQGINRDAAEAHERDLLEYAEARVRELPGITLVGTAAQRAGVLSFMIDGTHPHDVGMLLDQQGVAVRTGNHCAQPIMDQLGIPGTIRASFCFYNTRADIDRLVEALVKAKQFLVEE